MKTRYPPARARPAALPIRAKPARESSGSGAEGFPRRASEGQKARGGSRPPRPPARAASPARPLEGPATGKKNRPSPGKNPVRRL
jgi:hypothetical protein